jgi:hypothetical protein
MDFPFASISPSLLVRTHILKYSVTSDRVRRVQPVAVNAEQFVEEWLSRPWVEAVQWSDSARRRALQDRHERLKLETLGYLPYIQYCPPDRTQMEISFLANFPPAIPAPNELLFVVREITPNVFRMMNIVSQQIPGCSTPEPANGLPQHLLPESLNRRR